MQLEFATEIARAAATLGLGLDVELRERYSGRGMFGRSTAAVVVPKLGDFTAAACEAAVQLFLRGEYTEDFTKAIREIRTDSMGQGWVIY